MPARRLGLKLVLVLVIAAIALVAATAVAATSGDRRQSGVGAGAPAAAGETSDRAGGGFNTQAIQSDRGDGLWSGDQSSGTTDRPQTPAPARTSLDQPTQASETAGSNAGSREAVGPDTTAQARFGLCRAFADSGHTADASGREGRIAARNLAEAAAAAGQSVADFCSDVSHPTGDAARQDSKASPASPESGSSPHS